MASRALTPLLRRSIVATRMQSKALRGGSPPLPAYVRIPAPSEPLVENHDCLFDDACAPELALDFDCQNISTWEGIGSWLMGIGAFTTLYYTIKLVEDPPSRNPAITRAESDDIVVPVPYHD
eukprot:CAMPEP_0176120524 /NCGR_PEP_ID=MMETSP0120_2-20121206/60626_1 /TAXON_ID=160619 /ORGANISM="Kryptoperidinium foliaceum, Strain CCMP 1326" /LENGTH=121 /DNA_ID=CAMNT_0017454985 /DNA_START=57 /DNA_END=422 /DNA_ORIENTATION=+